MVAPSTGTLRDSWGSRAGFILAAVGSAVGLGNMWRFSYVAAEGGGAAFVLLYLFFIAIVGIPLMTSEFVVGRMTGLAPVAAIKKLGGKAWAPLGVLFAVCGLGILSYYSVIAGWTMRYALDAALGNLPTDPAASADYFFAVGGGIPAVVTHVIFMTLTIFIVVRGINKGLEKTAIVLMPLLFFILVGLAIWAGTLSGGGEGYAYYLRPHLKELLNPAIITDAAGQAFFSLSLGMGALMTYASYLNSKENLFNETVTIALADFGVAFIAGLFVFPIIFHFGLVEAIGLGGELNTDSTVGTLFIAIPPALLGATAGQWVVFAFFVMLLFAALTSAISLLEVVVAALIDGLGWTRTKAALVGGISIAILGLASAYSLNILDVLDKLVGTVLLMVGGLATSILVGYKILPDAESELAIGAEGQNRKVRVWRFAVRYIVPPVLFVVLLFSIPKLIASLGNLFG